jgi:hypothetical protein
LILTLVRQYRSTKAAGDKVACGRQCHAFVVAKVTSGAITKLNLKEKEDAKRKTG